MEGTQCKLCTRLADGLCCDDADGLALLDHLARGKVAAVALGADAVFGLAGEHRTDFDFFDVGLFDALADLFGQLFAGLDDKLVGLRVVDVVDRGTAKNLLAEALDDVLAFLEGCRGQAAQGAAVLFGDDDVVGHVDQTTGEVTGVSRLKSGIG